MIPSGPQYWHKQIVTTSKDRFAYCSTLSIYICNVRTHEVEKIITGHEGVITCIEWNLLDSNLLASATNERQLYIWKLSEEIAILHMTLESYALMLQWSKISADMILILDSSGKSNNNFRGDIITKCNYENHKVYCQIL